MEQLARLALSCLIVDRTGVSRANSVALLATADYAACCGAPASLPTLIDFLEQTLHS